MALLELVGLISGIATILGFLLVLKKIDNSGDATSARILKLEEQLKRADENYTDGLNRSREYYDKRIERQEQEVKELHDGLDKMGEGIEKLRKLTTDANIWLKAAKSFSTENIPFGVYPEKPALPNSPPASAPNQKPPD